MSSYGRILKQLKEFDYLVQEVLLQEELDRRDVLEKPYFLQEWMM